MSCSGSSAKPLEVAFEATYGWGWFADLLEDVGIPAHMAHPRANKAISSARVKNDAVDAKTLAHLLRTDLLPESWIAPPAVREARRLVRMRTALVRIRPGSRIRSTQSWPTTGSIQRGATSSQAAHLAELGRQLPVLARQHLEANLRLIDDIDREVDGADTQIHKLFARDAGVRRLMPIPGIGIITAAIIVAEVGDITRFPSARHFCFWCGLTSTEHSSADHTRRGHISKQGSRCGCHGSSSKTSLSPLPQPGAGRRPRLGRQPPQSHCPHRAGAAPGHAQLLRSPQPAGLPKPSQSDDPLPVGAHPFRVHGLTDGPFLIGSLDRMLTMASTAE